MPMRTTDDARRQLRTELESWHRIQHLDLLTRYYLVFRRTTDEADGVLSVVMELPGPDYEYVTPQHLPRNATVDQVYNQMLPHLYGLPILAYR